MRVVSLVPAATEALCAIGGREMLVGRSAECDEPAGIEAVPIIVTPAVAATDPAAIDRAVQTALQDRGTLYTLDADLLRSLRPDVILTQDLCQVCSIDLQSVRAVAASLEPPPRVLSFDPHSIEDVLDDLLRLGAAINLERNAERLVSSLRERMFRAMDCVTPFVDGPSVAVLEWTDPLFVAGHWTPQLVERAGGRHPLNPTVPSPDAGAALGPQQASRRAGKSIRITPEALVASRPDFLVICPCGRGLSEAATDAASLAAQPWWPDLPAVQHSLQHPGEPRIAIVDGRRMFARPSPRLIDALEWLTGWLNNRPELIPAAFPWEAFAITPTSALRS